MVKLSIIIPYYQTYELTVELLNSLISQLYEGVEIILVDDGCYNDLFDMYNIEWGMKIIHQENMGVSGARNRGLKEAQGKYIAFIDSDDMVMPNYVHTLLDLIETRNEDIIYFNWLDINTNDVIRHPSNPAVWKAIYKKEILPMFDEKLKAKEDYYYQLELKKQPYTEYYYDKVLYIYNSGREDSLTQKDKRGELY